MFLAKSIQHASWTISSSEKVCLLLNAHRNVSRTSLIRFLYDLIFLQRNISNCNVGSLSFKMQIIFRCPIFSDAQKRGHPQWAVYSTNASCMKLVLFCSPALDRQEMSALPPNLIIRVTDLNPPAGSKSVKSNYRDLNYIWSLVCERIQYETY